VDIREILKTVSTRQSQWEFDNFIIESFGIHKPRAILSLLNRRRELQDALDDMNLASHTNRTDQQEMLIECGRIDAWLNQHAEDEIRTELAKLEEGEAAFWAEDLGRQCAVDLLTQGRASKEVMSRAVLLPEAQYRKFAETCGTIMHVIDTVTREVEEDQGYHVNSLPEGQPR
jgi:hypothetical protein